MVEIYGGRGAHGSQIGVPHSDVKFIHGLSGRSRLDSVSEKGDHSPAGVTRSLGHSAPTDMHAVTGYRSLNVIMHSMHWMLGFRPSSHLVRKYNFFFYFKYLIEFKKIIMKMDQNQNS